MSKFNRPARSTAVAPTGTSPLRSAGIDAKTHEGGFAASRDSRTELFLLATGGFIAEDSFYETADDRIGRYIALVRELAIADPDWLWQFLVWLRADAHIRTAAGVGALEAVHARLEQERIIRQAHPDLPWSGLPTQAPGQEENAPPGFRPPGWSRTLIDQVCHRADEPGEMLAYWLRQHGKQVPQAIKRGLAMAAVRLFTERAALKYDSDNASVRFGDVIEICHPKPDGLVGAFGTDPGERAYSQSDLFRWLIDRRHGREHRERDYALPVVQGRRWLQSLPVNERRAVLTAPQEQGGGPRLLRQTGMTWESVSGWLQSPLDTEIWETLIPTMGMFALVRNLANFDRAGVGQEARELVMHKLTDPGEVKMSRLLPMRFYQAFRAAELDWHGALERALNLSTQNVPALAGKSLVLVDTSASMRNPLSEKSRLSFAEVAALFGATLATRAGTGEDSALSAEGADLFGFAGQGWGRYRGSRCTFRHSLAHREGGPSVLDTVTSFVGRIGEVGHGTEIVQSIRETWKPEYARVVVISDMQTHFENGDVVDDVVPPTTPIYGFNLVGYQHGVLAGSGSRATNRFDLGGLTDHTFAMMAALERGEDASWPWESATPKGEER